MEVTRRRTYHFNTGGFEFVEVSAEIKMTVNPAEDMSLIYAQIDEELDMALKQELNEIYALNGNKQSLIEEHPLVKKVTTE